jgi:acyl-CoA dehydrogenase family protein 9
MPLTAQQIEQQRKQAEELLFEGPQTLGFAKSLYFGHFNAPLVFPYPQLRPDERAEVEETVTAVERFLADKVDSFAIDRNADIPAEVIAGLGRLGILGMTAPKEYGGRGFSQLGNTKILEAIGAHDASIAVFVNAHHSIGIRALLLFGTEEQKERWLPDLAGGRKLAAFALTETEAGSDAANVQTTATPTPDGRTYILNGQKRYITNGGIAGVLTVMARTPARDEGRGTRDESSSSPHAPHPSPLASAPLAPRPSPLGAVTAFLVTPDMPGFEVVEARMPKCGIRGTATARLAFHDMPVPAENILGPLGKGLRLALTVLDFGRTTFGASCTGAAKTCLKAAVRHAQSRIQFKQPIGEFELIKKKIAWMAAHAFAMEATTTQCAAFIDRGAEDYMLETAMLKVFSTEALWRIVNDTLQIYGGQGYFSDEPYERMMRDARINQIGEGANEVLSAFIALVGMRGVGEHLQGVLSAFKHPIKEWGTLWRFGRNQLAARLTSPDVPVVSADLRPQARTLGKRVGDFGLAVQAVLRHYREAVLERQYLQERIALAACDLYASACTISRLDSLLVDGNHNPDVERDIQAGRYFLTLANRRIQENLAALWDNDDAETTKTADAFLRP